MRMECQAGLNKGEARHTLARAVFAHSQGRIRDRSHDAQQKRVMALNLVIAAIVYWNTLYMDKATDHLQRQGRLPDPSLLRHVSPLGWDHIILTGDYDWNSGAAERTNVRPLNLYPAIAPRVDPHRRMLPYRNSGYKPSDDATRRWRRCGKPRRTAPLPSRSEAYHGRGIGCVEEETTMKHRLTATFAARLMLRLVACFVSFSFAAVAGAQSQPTPRATALGIDIDASDRVAFAVVESLPGLKDSIGFFVICAPLTGQLRAGFSFGPYPSGKPVQAEVRLADGRVERFGPVVRGGASSGSHSPRYSVPGDVVRLVESAFAHGSLVSNGHNSVWNDLGSDVNARVRRRISECGSGMDAPSQPTMEEAVAASRRGDHGAALIGFRFHAERGNATAQYNLGVMYEYGRGVPVDAAEAVRWYHLAAERGLAQAQNNLGRAYAVGRGVPEDDVEAARWYRLAAEQGLAMAQVNLGFMYSTGEGVPVDHAESVRLYRLAADQDLAIAQYNLGAVYGAGRGVPEDDAEAARWYRLAAEQGLSSAQFNLGLMYANGEGVPEDSAEAVRWLLRAAGQGHARARSVLRKMHADDMGVSKDATE